MLGNLYYFFARDLVKNKDKENILKLIFILSASGLCFSKIGEILGLHRRTIGRMVGINWRDSKIKPHVISEDLWALSYLFIANKNHRGRYIDYIHNTYGPLANIIILLIEENCEFWTDFVDKVQQNNKENISSIIINSNNSNELGYVDF